MYTSLLCRSPIVSHKEYGQSGETEARQSHSYNLEMTQKYTKPSLNKCFGKEWPLGDTVSSSRRMPIRDVFQFSK